MFRANSAIKKKHDRIRFLGYDDQKDKIISSQNDIINPFTGS
jgi:hypothetical protein